MLVFSLMMRNNMSLMRDTHYTLMIITFLDIFSAFLMVSHVPLDVGATKASFVPYQKWMSFPEIRSNLLV